MDTFLWVVEIVLAVVFTITGLVKVTQPRARMAAGPMPWAADVSDAQFRAIGVLELLGAAGLVLPRALGVATFLVPLAALGLALTMVGAFATHLRLGEVGRAAVPAVMFALAVFVAIGAMGSSQAL
jgi:uncharacterized membrane protein